MSRPGFTIGAKRITERGKPPRLEFDNTDRYRALLGKLNVERVTVTVEKEIKARSLKQNNFFHAVVVPLLADYWGLDAAMKAEFEEAKDLIKLHCNAKTVEIVNKTTGEVREVTIGGSTSALNKEEWGLFIDRCQRWAAIEFGVVIPDPDPEFMFNKKDKAA